MDAAAEVATAGVGGATAGVGGATAGVVLEGVMQAGSGGVAAWWAMLAQEDTPGAGLQASAADSLDTQVTEVDIGGTEVDIGGTEVDIGGTEVDVGGMEVDVGDTVATGGMTAGTILQPTMAIGIMAMAGIPSG
jgi:hypothetical protein